MVDEGADPTQGGSGDDSEDLSLDEFRHAHLMRVLEACGNDVDEAARVLGLSPTDLRRELRSSNGNGAV